MSQNTMFVPLWAALCTGLGTEVCTVYGSVYWGVALVTLLGPKQWGLWHRLIFHWQHVNILKLPWKRQVGDLLLVPFKNEPSELEGASKNFWCHSAKDIVWRCANVARGPLKTQPDLFLTFTILPGVLGWFLKHQRSVFDQMVHRLIPSLLELRTFCFASRSTGNVIPSN